jgi:hypothetical protein
MEALTLDEYPWELHKQIVDSGAPLERAYVNSWKYVLLVLLAKQVLGYHQVAKLKLLDMDFWHTLINPNRRYLHRFLTLNYGSTSPSFIEILVDRARRIRSISVPNFLQIDTSEDASTRLSQSINYINREIQSRILQILSPRKKYYLIFDQLDAGWDASAESKNLLIGLILAARDLNRTARDKSKQVRVLIFLRTDIYESLRFEDKNKLSGSLVELKWDESYLKQMVEKRIASSANGSWDDVFTGEKLRGSTTQLSYIVKRTMLRPRDMIRFCEFSHNEALASCLQQIDKESIYQAARPYSNYMRQEIIDETKASIPDIDTLLENIRELRKEVIDKDDFLNLCTDQGIDGEKALMELIELGLFGVYRPGGNRRGTEVVYRYQAAPSQRLNPSSKLQIHPSLKYELELIEPRKRRDNNVSEEEDNTETNVS